MQNIAKTYQIFEIVPSKMNYIKSDNVLGLIRSKKRPGLAKPPDLAQSQYLLHDWHNSVDHNARSQLRPRHDKQKHEF